MSKLFEKLYTLRVMKTVEGKQLITNHQFGFRAKHSTLEHVHQVSAKNFVLPFSLTEIRKRPSGLFL
jgi:hypothetical protein